MIQPAEVIHHGLTTQVRRHGVFRKTKGCYVLHHLFCTSRMQLDTFSHSFAHERFQYWQKNRNKRWWMANMETRLTGRNTSLQTFHIHLAEGTVHLRELGVVGKGDIDNTEFLGYFILQGGVKYVPHGTTHALSRVFALVLFRRINKDDGSSTRIFGARERKESCRQRHHIVLERFGQSERHKGLFGSENLHSLVPVLGIASSGEL
jgi:hypothetical protein